VTLAALTDHNSSLNCPAFKTACEKEGIAPRFGMEAQSAEEVHLLCLFSRLETALAFSEEIYATLPPVRNVPEKMGDQVYVNEEDEILGEVEKYLVISSEYDVFALAERVRSLGGLAIPAHADRVAFSLTSQFGYIPDGPWDAIEMMRPPKPGEHSRFGGFPDKPVTQSSDAHYIESIAARPFYLDIGGASITSPDGETDLAVVRRGLEGLKVKG
jgi:hypothetical protein